MFACLFVCLVMQSESWWFFVNLFQHENCKRKSQISDSSFRQHCCALCHLCKLLQLVLLQPSYHFICCFCPSWLLPSPPAAPMCLSLLPPSIHCFALNFSDAQYSQLSVLHIILQVHAVWLLISSKVPTVCLWPLLSTPFSSHPVVGSLHSLFAPKGLLTAQKLQLQSRRAAVILQHAVTRLASQTEDSY